jgi:hypothetical protein
MNCRRIAESVIGRFVLISRLCECSRLPERITSELENGLDQYSQRSREIIGKTLNQQSSALVPPFALNISFHSQKSESSFAGNLLNLAHN